MLFLVLIKKGVFKMSKKVILLVFTALYITSCNNLPEEIEEQRKSVKSDMMMLSRVTGSPDRYEDNDTPYKARSIYSDNSSQNHNFYDDPNDYSKFYAISGSTYLIDTEVTQNADTVLYLYDSYAKATSSVSSNSHAAYNDDYNINVGYASRIIYKAQKSGYHYIKCASYAGRTGAGRSYSIRVSRVKVFVNYSFDSNHTGGWNAVFKNGAEGGLWFIDTDANSKSGTAVVHQTKTAQSLFSVTVFNKRHQFFSGKKYEMIFDICIEGANSKTVVAAIDEGVPGSTVSTNALKYYSTGLNWDTHKLVGTGRRSTSNGQFSFYLGGENSADVFFDNIICIEHLN